jgi:glycerol-3-phosphate dehydrogenase subunit C
VLGPQAQRFRAIEAIAEDAVGLCSGCGICTSVCPNGVEITDIITMAKATLRENGKRPSVGVRLLSRPDLVGRLAGAVPWLANLLLENRLMRLLAQKVLGISARGALPAITGKEFRRWLKRRRQPEGQPIAYFTGCSIEHFEARVGQAVVGLLNHLGYRVEAPADVCCGLPLLSNGEWVAARGRAEQLVKALLPSATELKTIVSSSTSCSLTLRKKYRAYLDMQDQASTAVAQATTDICIFLRDRHSSQIAALLKPLSGKVLYHGPCQLRGHQAGWPAVELLSAIPNLQLELSVANCCGTAGTYGLDQNKRSIAEAVSMTLFDQVRAAMPDFIVCDSETCRWHIAAETGLPCFHPAEIILASIENRPPMMTPR